MVLILIYTENIFYIMVIRNFFFIIVLKLVLSKLQNLLFIYNYFI